jgi:sugar-phosphatase
LIEHMELRAAAILFDNDGVLSDSTTSVDVSWRRFVAAHGLDPDRVLPFIHGRPVRESLAELAPHLDLDAAAAELEALELSTSGDVAPIAGAVALTAALPPERWIVVTSGTRRLAAARLECAGINAPAMVTADDVARGKPDPEPYRTAAARLGVEPGDCLVFEDTAAGAAAGRGAGATVIGVVGSEDGDIGADHHIIDLTRVSIAVDDGGLSVSLA